MSTYNLDKKGAFVFNGEKGESLFIEPFFDKLKGSLEETFELPHLFRRIEKAGDERSLAIMTALIVENRVDEILRVFMTGYDDLAKNKDFTMSMKTGLLSAMRMFPKHIIACADVVRQIRNDFAHNLEKESFDNVERKYLDKLSALFTGIYGKEESGKKTAHEKFKGIAYIAIFGLHLYKRNVQMLWKVVTSHQFAEELEAKAYQEFVSQMEGIEGGEVTVKDEGGMRVTRKAGIIVGIERIMNESA